MMIGPSCIRGNDSKVIAYDEVMVYRDYPPSGPPEQKQVIAVIAKGTVSDVIQERYSKDFMYYKIKIRDGREGYVWVGDKFTVMAKQGRK